LHASRWVRNGFENAIRIDFLRDEKRGSETYLDPNYDYINNGKLNEKAQTQVPRFFQGNNRCGHDPGEQSWRLGTYLRSFGTFGLERLHAHRPGLSIFPFYRWCFHCIRDGEQENESGRPPGPDTQGCPQITHDLPALCDTKPDPKF